MRPVRRATLAATHAHGVSLDCGSGLGCRISLLGEDLARVVFLRGGVPRQPRTWMVPEAGAADVPWEGRDRLAEDSWPVPQWRLEQSSGGLTLHTAALSVHIALESLALSWSLPDGTVFARDRARHAYVFAERARTLRHCLARHPADGYYGLGDKTGPLNLHGRRLRTVMTDALGYDAATGDPLYKHWPFVIGRDGATGTAYGLFYDNAAAATFDLGCEHENYYDFFRSYEAEDGDLDYYFWVGPTLRAVTQKFLRLTGRTALPPRWTLGYAQTAMAIADVPDAQARMEDFIARAGTEDIPVSAFHFGSGYTSIGPKRYVFNWNRNKFPDPEGLMRRFHDAGMHIVANLKPCLLDDHPRYGEALAQGAFVRQQATGAPVITQFWDGEGAHLDFTSPAGIAWWQHGLRTQVLATGIDSAWNDNNEYGLFDEDGIADGFGAPIPMALARPIQPLLMTRASIEAQRAAKPAERAFTVSRAGCPGVQRYAQGWSGDNTTSWHTLKWNLRTGLGMSLSGLYNTGHDIGGFAGPVPDAELLVRWTQAGAVHPRFIMNSWKPDGVYNAPWLHGEATPAIRAAIRLRYRLMPYLYSLMHAAATADEPILMPTFVAFETDPATFADCDDLLLGPFLLAAPVVTPGARMRTAYLPAGPECWFDFYSGERLAAGAVAVLAAPLDRLPLVVPAGAMLPMTDAGEDFSRLHDEPSRCVGIFPGPGTGSSRFDLIEDDGISAGGPVTTLSLLLSWTPSAIQFHLEAAGDFPLGYETIRVVLPEQDRRTVSFTAGPGAPRLI
jgi:alpha-glucosidase